MTPAANDVVILKKKIQKRKMRIVLQRENFRFRHELTKGGLRGQLTNQYRGGKI